MPGNIPTGPPYVAIPNAYNWSQILSSCCGNTTTTFPPDNNCYVVCQIGNGDAPAVVEDCVSLGVRRMNQSMGISVTKDKKSGARSLGVEMDWRRGGKLGWVVLGVAFVGAVCGLL
jgi:hypothetical protein